jgi:hypothetical protein
VRAAMHQKLTSFADPGRALATDFSADGMPDNG